MRTSAGGAAEALLDISQLTLLRMDATAKIRALNDALRNLTGEGRLFVTAGISALPLEQQAVIMRRVFTYSAFTPANDPYGEHDFGSFECDGVSICWKIDYYDRTLVRGSPDPADEAVTTRVLTVNGFEVVAVCDGKSAIKAIRDTQFDVVIVDLFMPGMDGLSAIKRFRRLDPQMPIIVASGFMFAGECPVMPHFEEMSKKSGACSVLYKPFKPQEVLSAIRSAIGPTGTRVL